MNKEEMKRAILVAIGIIIVIIFIKSIQKNITIEDTLKNRGYNETEIAILKEKLTEEELNYISNKEYNQYLPKIINNKYYIPNNLQKYLEYVKTENNIDKVIGIINTGADKEYYTFTKEVTNLNNSMLVNKYNYLPADYNPNDIVSIKNWYAYDGHSIKNEVYNQYVKMWNDANNEGLKLIVNTSYRTLEDQTAIYNASNEKYVTRPGFSEHQTGLALDIITNSSDFESSNEFTWLKNNAHKYGFILRYPKDKEYITGINYEPWHYRYLGVELATKVHESNLTYEEYYAYFCEYKGEC